MKNTELRIGNSIYFDDKIQQIDWSHFKFIYYKDSLLKKFKPITLTDEWLLKFKKDEYGEFWNNLSKDINGIFIWVSGYKIYIKYVHELQNLYFALTKNEIQRVDG